MLKGLAGRLRIPLSVDTYRADTARRALDVGVPIINDISGLGYDPGLGAVVAARGAALVLMHTRGRPRDMYHEAHYEDVVGEVARELQRSVERAVGGGVPWDRLIIDPGLGFAKRAEHSLDRAGVTRIVSRRLGRPLLVGPSRKSFLHDGDRRRSRRRRARLGDRCGGDRRDFRRRAHRPRAPRRGNGAGGARRRRHPESRAERDPAPGAGADASDRHRHMK